MPHSQQTTVALIDLAAINHHSPAGAQIDIAMRKFNGLSLLEWSIRRFKRVDHVGRDYHHRIS